jgi:hypothetical protein
MCGLSGKVWRYFNFKGYPKLSLEEESTARSRTGPRGIRKSIRDRSTSAHLDTFQVPPSVVIVWIWRKFTTDPKLGSRIFTRSRESHRNGNVITHNPYPGYIIFGMYVLDVVMTGDENSDKPKLRIREHEFQTKWNF